ncbi:Mannosyl-oligosaccharide 1,2-alpha-mannosidase [Wickerhamiella sorbophila]|uniref:alpha-1,2-Mannosidase n=1 Tax=Wickerhamiella sorbophila TaxID=45607 RepID=A0A2T0FHY5_9ASCO|nr:Mannosyl-oligosaccharide 1,2-alpha-mannosidase [Wickerhamiella sorbophila]PRT54600.1 Mannosyl-oligosaccharide 1,2-alpha-mannosidase [Wickerhamiella sorbophila]
MRTSTRAIITLAVAALAIYFYPLIYAGNKEKALPTAEEMQRAVQEAFVRSWNGYKEHAWGSDIYHPISQKGENMVGSKPMGWMIVDSIDTMMLMGLDDEVKEARDWIEKNLDYDIDMPVSVFETTIRMLGGLLSAYYLSGDEMYLEKARDLADRILPAFGSPTGIPTEEVNLKRGVPDQAFLYTISSTAEVATLQLEFKYLAHLTKDEKYWRAVENVMKALEATHMPNLLLPIFISPRNGMFSTREIRMGSRGDSYYEYLLKQWLQTSQKEEVYRDMYDETVAGIKQYMVQYSTPNHLLFIGELPQGVGGGQFSPKMDHLVCFAGGMFAIGATNGKTLAEAQAEGWTTEQAEDFALGEQLTRSCVETYLQTATGLGPEIVVFNTDPDSTKDFFIKPLDRHNLQRPETVESLFYLYRLTNDPKYRKWGWQIFQSFEKYGRLEDSSGYTCLRDVETPNGERIDNMESFWLAETLKYLWLLFDDNNTWPLDKVVFNTEAHPLPVIPKSFSTGWERLYPYA